MADANDKRIKGIIVIGSKKYIINLIVLPKDNQLVEILNSIYRVNKVKFKEVKQGIIPIVYLKKHSYQRNKGKRKK